MALTVSSDPELTCQHKDYNKEDLTYSQEIVSCHILFVSVINEGR